ncbi:preprotein translocase subunit SecG [Patescibacteria group bacterium]|nr:preprotein translocase subunit SecG [Patescibacteria group bacterium]
MKDVITLIQITLGIILIVIIIIQQKGSGLGGSFGGDMSFYRTRRGAEKFLFYATIAVAVAFVLFSIIGLF